MTEKDVIKESRPRMDAVIEDVRRKLATVRTGRAAVSLLDSVMVDYYGTPTPLTEERRKQLAKHVHEIAEEHRTAIRNVRRDANDRLKKMLKDKTISEDAERDALDEIQKLTKTYIGKIDELAKNKEQELMSV